MKIGFSQHYAGPGGARTWIKGFSEYCEAHGHLVSFGPHPNVDVFCSVANLSTPKELSTLKSHHIKILQRLGAIYLVYNHPNPLLIQNKNNELKEIMSYADHYVYQSQFSKHSLFGSLYNNQEPDGDIIYNCADSRLFTSIGPRLDRPKDKKVILAAAYWGTPHTATHSISILTQVIEHFLPYKDIEFWVLGRAFPPDEQRLKEANYPNVTKLDLLNPIDYALMPSMLRTVDMVLHLKAHEGCSNMVIETMHTGTPLVGLSSGSLPELVGDAALLANCTTNIDSFPQVDLEDLISKIQFTLDNTSSLKEKMLTRAQQFTSDTTYQKYLSDFQNLI